MARMRQVKADSSRIGDDLRDLLNQRGSLNLALSLVVFRHQP
jgi:hypothetical protein